jgi:aryl-alcohol dehydrogenase-like predicted oxidoreductase
MINPRKLLWRMRVLNFAYKHGIRYFDTAPSYGKGEEFLITGILNTSTKMLT